MFAGYDDRCHAPSPISTQEKESDFGKGWSVIGSSWADAPFWPEGDSSPSSPAWSPESPPSLVSEQEVVDSFDLPGHLSEFHHFIATGISSYSVFPEVHSSRTPVSNTWTMRSPSG